MLIRSLYLARGPCNENMQVLWNYVQMITQSHISNLTVISLKLAFLIVNIIFHHPYWSNCEEYLLIQMQQIQIVTYAGLHFDFKHLIVMIYKLVLQ